MTQILYLFQVYIVIQYTNFPDQESNLSWSAESAKSNLSWSAESAKS